MRVIAKPALIAFYTQHDQAKAPLLAWWKTTTHARWSSLIDIRRTFPATDAVGRLTVFNIGGNKYRLITRIDYRAQIIWIRRVLTHAEYSKEDWKHDPWY